MKYLDKINGREVVQYEKGAINTKGLADNEIKLSGTNIIIRTKIARQAIQAIQATRIVPCNGYIKIEILYNFFADVLFFTCGMNGFTLCIN